MSTFSSLAIIAVLAWVFVGATRLTGLSDETSVMLGGLADGIDARGILPAGIVIGALGVLDDVTVTQVAAVWELKRSIGLVAAVPISTWLAAVVVAGSDSDVPASEAPAST